MARKIQEDAQSFGFLSRTMGLTVIISDCVRNTLHSRGQLQFLPGQGDPVCSRKHFVDALNETLDKTGARGELQAIKILKAERAKQQAFHDRSAALDMRKLK